jgi:uncharacterized protein (TIGR00251 family)
VTGTDESLEFLEARGNGVLLRVLVQPRASRNELAGIQQGALKVRLTAPPVEGAANLECARFLAKILDVAPSAITLVSGHKSRRKTFLVQQTTPERIGTQLQRYGLK